MADMHHLPDISKSGNPNSCHSQPTPPADFPIQGSKDSVLSEFSPKILVTHVFSLCLLPHIQSVWVVLALPSKYSQHSAISPPFIVITPSPLCHQLPLDYCSSPVADNGGLFSAPKRGYQWMECCWVFFFQLQFAFIVSLSSFQVCNIVVTQLHFTKCFPPDIFSPTWHHIHNYYNVTDYIPCAVLYTPCVFCNYQFGLLNPFTSFTEPPKHQPLWQPLVCSLCLFQFSLFV